MHHTIRAALACTAVFTVAACTKTEKPATDTAAAAAAAAPAPAPAAPTPIALASVAGKWNVVSTPVSGKDTSSTKVVMTATADTTPWTFPLPSGKTVKNHVTVSGDSIMLKSDTYKSLRRKGKDVWTETVYHVKDGKLAGTMVAHYLKSGADSVLSLKVEGTKQ